MKYVHGYSDRENERLRHQSDILATLLHEATRYPAGSEVLEAGCGVGGQTIILAENSPGARFTSVDISEKSLEQAGSVVKKGNFSNVTFRLEDVRKLSFADNSFDHIFVCFLLEHLDHPEGALLELKRVLRPGGTITVIEGDHGSCFWNPETLESIQVWQSLITVQQRLGHDPLIGRRIDPLLREAGFAVQDVSPRLVYGDQGKQQLLDDMVNRIIVPMVSSSKKEILDAKIVDIATWNKGISDLSRTSTPPDGTFFYTWFKGLAIKKE